MTFKRGREFSIQHAGPNSSRILSYESMTHKPMTFSGKSMGDKETTAHSAIQQRAHAIGYRLPTPAEGQRLRSISKRPARPTQSTAATSQQREQALGYPDTSSGRRPADNGAYAAQLRDRPKAQRRPPTRASSRLSGYQQRQEAS